MESTRIIEIIVVILTIVTTSSLGLLNIVNTQAITSYNSPIWIAQVQNVKLYDGHELAIKVAAWLTDYWNTVVDKIVGCFPITAKYFTRTDIGSILNKVAQASNSMCDFLKTAVRTFLPSFFPDYFCNIVAQFIRFLLPV
ncbi:hypothetical protein ACJDU8_22000 [Clostridium sp. WILCCON 0269]|uniref:Uncharacterized protein n=1 Tax=Candidatus Clostridium eludens TaxID=3381663 RepID=A0ABW8SSA5_9CLOT